jgi:hypothetical protein
VGIAGAHGVGLSFEKAPPGSSDPQAQGQATRYGIQPGSERTLPAQATGAARQDEESSLKDVLGVVRVGQHAAGHAQHERAVPSQECLKSGLVVPPHELIEQLDVTQFAGAVRAQEAFELP